jgi:hypothetical protein
MGNTFSSPNQTNDIKSLSSHIDDIAIHYILKQNTIDLLRLTDKEYYDNLIVLVSNLFDRRLSDMEIGSIYNRIFPEKVQDVVQNILPSNEKIKNNMISNISKFYIKIMMIFSAIVATIDPQYSYEDDDGTKQLFYLKDIHSYKNIPKHVQPMVHQLTNPMNLCRKRISILRNKMDFSDPDFITINPGEKICSTDSTSHLTDEIGIKELDLLYYDVFDPNTKTWKSRSKEMEEKYKNDLKKFFTVFTGKAEMPDHIKSFKDIELFDFKSIDYCRDSLFTHDFIIPKDNQLIVRYKEQLELLEKSTSEYRNTLLNIIKRLFLTKIVDNDTTYSIQPKLTLDEILKIEQDTRNTIIDLYTNCEQYFIRALLIFEELYDTQSKSINESRMTTLENMPLYQDTLIHSNNPNWSNKPKAVTIFPNTKEGMTPMTQIESNPSKSAIVGMPVPTLQDISALSEPFSIQDKTLNYISPPTVPVSSVDQTPVQATTSSVLSPMQVTTPDQTPLQTISPPVQVTTPEVNPMQVTTNPYQTPIQTISPPVQVTGPDQSQVQVTTPEVNPMQVTTNPYQTPMQTISPPVQVTTLFQNPVQTISPPVQVTIPDQSQVQVTTPEVNPIQVTAPEVNPIQVTSPEVNPIQVTAPDQSQVKVTNPEQTQVQATAPEQTPLQVTTPEVNPMQVTAPVQSSEVSPMQFTATVQSPVQATISNPEVSPMQVTTPETSTKNNPNPQNGENPQNAGVVPVNQQNAGVVPVNPQNGENLQNAGIVQPNPNGKNTIILPKPQAIPVKPEAEKNETIMEKISNLWKAS